VSGPSAVADVAGIYQAAGYRSLWHGDREAEQRQRELLGALADAHRHGLPSFDRSLWPEAKRTSERAVAENDVRLTTAFLAYASALRHGTVGADVFGDDWGIAPVPYDAPAALITSIKRGNFSDLLAALAPRAPEYRALVDALDRYRTIAATGGWPALPVGPEPNLGADPTYVSGLQRRLRVEDDTVLRDGLTTGALIEAVRRFQARHGLEPDGRIGRLTQQALNVPVEQRIGQIAANLERWRHLPHELPPSYVAVNAADATLALMSNGHADLRMRTVVGDLRHPTPVLSARIAAITINPPWNVPTSIARKEILPRLQRDRLYLQKNAIAIVGAEEDPFGLRINWRSIQRQAFPFRLQQHPGPNNSLGVVKLEMPNRYDVYLHDTPAKKLFERPVRTFSHGCVRLERATELALRLLSDRPEWTRDAFAAAIASGDTRHVPLTQPVPVYVLYWTAFVDGDGQVQFRDDIYGRDAAIVRRLHLDAPPATATRPVADRGCHGQQPLPAAG
jgi:murein L,D-transpeptidase YcbB/YkuD